jgi:WD40 repeat protein
MGRHQSRTITLLVVLQLISSWRVFSQEHPVGTAEPRAVLAGNRDHAIRCLTFSPDKRFLAVARFGNVVEVWNIAASQVAHTLRGEDIWAREMAFSPNGKFLAVAGSDNTVSVWDIGREKEAFILRGHKQGVYAVAFRPDGNALATGGRDQTARIWDLATGQEKLVFNRHALKPDENGFVLGGWVSAVAFSPDGMRVASTSSFLDRKSKIGHVKVWETPTGKELVSIEGAADLVQFDTRGKKIASSNWNGLTIWDAATGKPISFLPVDGGMFSCIAFTQEGRCVAVLSTKEALKVFEATSKAELLTISGRDYQIATLSLDGSLLASSPDQVKVEIRHIPEQKK